MHQMLRIIIFMFEAFRSMWTLKFRIQPTFSFLGFKVQGSHVFFLIKAQQIEI